MGAPFIGEIRMFAGNFAPAGWELCDGRLMSISENDTLFALIGTTYGGDGQSTFALPDLRGRIPVHMGQGPGLSNYVIGQQGGVESVTLTTAQIPNHSHPLTPSKIAANASSPNGTMVGQSNSIRLYFDDTPSVPMRAGMIQNVGGNQPHSNLMPSLCINFIISLFGIFPSTT